MKYLRHYARYVVVLLLASAPRTDAQIIDRMKAVVNNHIITLSDVNREKVVREVLGYKGPNDDKSILQDLIDAQIIEDEITQSANVDVTEEAVDREFSKISDYRGLPASVIRDALRRRLRADQFFDIRFRQVVRVTDDEIQQYYQDRFVPEAQKSGMNPIPPLAQVTESVQKNIIEEKTVQEVDKWLATNRQRSDVEIFP